MKLYRPMLALFAGVATLGALAAPAQADVHALRREHVLGTSLDVVAVGVDRPTALRAFEAVAAEIDRRSDELDRQSEVLKQCLQKLPETHRAIIVWRYYEDCDIAAIAVKSGRTEEAVYRLLSRIRQALSECIGRNSGGSAAMP